MSTIELSVLLGENVAHQTYNTQGGEKPPPQVKEKSIEEISIDSASHIDYNQITHSVREFDVDKELGKLVVKVVNSETKELIRQIPTDEMLRLAKKMKEINQVLYG
jgi:flagellar protein FlaG